jgi:hypothetical protein
MRAFSARFDRGSFFTAGSLALLAGVHLAACGQSADPGKGAISGGSGTGATTGTGASGGTSSGSGSTSSSGGSISLDGGAVSDSGLTDAGCASHTEAAEIQPVHLVILMDRSASMVGADVMQDLQAVKWDPLITALKGFFVDPTSEGLTASMILFPAHVPEPEPDPDAGPGPGGPFPGRDTVCTVEDYSVANVAATALPNPAFGTLLDMETPPEGFGTPTYPALAGAIAYAQAQSLTAPDHKFVIVMVTDGVPSECMQQGNSINAAAAAAAEVAAEIPTYVIGVGDSLDNLNAIAEGGGTDAAILVAIDDPAKTQADITSAINQIRGKEIACNISLPLPPVGETIDPFKVNVSFTPANGVAQVLTYDQSCTTGGWRYDDAVNPKAIELCEATCGAVTADQAKELSIILGCATEVPK